MLEEYALIARALSAPARLSLLEQLAQGERGVEALAEKTDLNIANCSQHLQQLRRAGLVTSRRDGKAVIYRLTDAKTLMLMDLLRIVAERNLAQVARILRGLSGGEDAPELVSRAELAERLAEGSVTVLDVRPTDEYAAGHVPGALNVPLAQLEEILPKLSLDEEIVAYCRGPYCVYAHLAVAALRSRGFNARRLEGGLPDWRGDGREVATSLSA
nr:metalloregulator ArsR/SmtB family transcription factor [Ruegeria sp. R13_0]